MTLQRELQVAGEVAAEAARLIMAGYEAVHSVEWKGADDPVTEVDRRSNELIIARLAARFPADAICAEESPTEDAARAAGRGGRCWFVDPLDGTREFMRRSGEFCVMIGLAEAGRALLGVVVAPVWGRTFMGVVGEGAFELGPDGNRRPLQVQPVADPAAQRVVFSRLHRNRQVEQAAERLGIRDIRECGSCGLKFMQVAAGEVELFLHTGPGPQLWDGCAPSAIAVAAGAEVTDATGAALRFDTSRLPLDRGLIVAAPALAAAALRALGHCAGQR